MGWAVTLMGYALFLFFPLNLCRLPDKEVGKEFLKKNKNKKHLCRLPRLAVGKKNTRRHGGRFLCRPPFDSRQIADCLHVAVGKESLCRPGLCRLPEWNAVGKVFADCIQAFADCFWQSAKNLFPVVKLYGELSHPLAILHSLALPAQRDQFFIK